MNFQRRRLFGWIMLAALVLPGGLWLWQLDYATRISTDIFDGVPATGAAPELMLVRQLAGEAEARSMFFELTINGRPAPEAAAGRFAAALLRAGPFDQAVSMNEATARDALAKEMFAQRLALLFPRWLHERRAIRAASSVPDDEVDWLARDAAAKLGKFTETPEALAFQELILADPLLLLPGAVERLKGGLALVQPEKEGVASALVWARLAVSPLSEAGQQPAFAAIEHATAETRREFAGLVVAFTGVNRFAAASRARIEREVKWLNAASLAAVLLVALAFIRRVYRGLHLLPVVLLAVGGAWVCTTVAFDRVSILVFVFGSLLTGVAIDYGFYLFVQPPARPDEDYLEKVRRLAEPLLASCLTAVAGFALLLFSDLPFIRQLGVFVGSGLLWALVAAVIYFSTVKNPYLETRELRWVTKLPHGLRRNVRWLLIAAWLAALPGLARLHWKDDIRELDIPSPELKQEDERIRARFGGPTSGSVFVTYGKDLAAARTALARLESWLDSSTGAPVQTVGLGSVVPTSGEAKEAAEFFRTHPDFPDRLRAALDRAGFDPAEFAPFFADYTRNAARPDVADPATALAALQAKLTGPLGLLVHVGQPFSWFVTLTAAPPAGDPPVEARTVSANQLQTLNQVFARYRTSALWLSVIGLAIVGTGVLLTYGARDGLRIFAIPCGACLGVFGLLGWLGQPLNLFHLLGAFLGVCLTHNYSIFSATSAYRHEPPPVSVRMSAFTASASFGVLALSDIPVVRALGLTVALMTLAALLVIEFEHLSTLGRKS
jgi:predicted exporter